MDHVYNPLLFAHTADLHLAPHNATIAKKDPATNRTVRDMDFEIAFENAVEDVLSHDPRPSAFVIAGDIFDTYKGSGDAFISAHRLLRRLSSNGIEVIGIAGNHDTPTNRMKRSMFEMLASSFEGDEHVHLAYDEIMTCRVGDVEYTMLPHISCLQGGFSAEDLMSDDSNVKHVLVVHGVAAGDPSLQQMDEMKEIPIAKWILDLDWDYIAFGHYHKPGWISGYEGKAAYSGSLENTVISGPDVVSRRGPSYIDLSKEGTDKRTMKALPIRKIVEVDDIDFTGLELNAEDIENSILEELLEHDLDGAIVKHTVKGISRAAYKTMSTHSFMQKIPEALYIKTMFEIDEHMYLDGRPESGSSASDEEAEHGDTSEKRSAISFEPLEKEITVAVDRFFEDSDYDDDRKREVLEIIVGML